MTCDSSKFQPDFCKQFIDKTLRNQKGVTTLDRHRDVMSDPNNLLIPRVPEAGSVTDDDFVVMHNGLLIKNSGFYGAICQKNLGAHEPSEERMFALVLQHMPPGATMIELGSYWCYYSMWFAKTVPDARLFCIEPNAANLQIGKDNCERNGVSAKFYNRLVGKNGIDINNVVKSNNLDKIDLLHSDIQGAEFFMLKSITRLLQTKKVNYIFLSTHGSRRQDNSLHNECKAFLTRHEYRVVAEADFENDTFCFDGIIVACPKENTEIPYIDLGSQKHTPLCDQPYENLPVRK